MPSSPTTDQSSPGDEWLSQTLSFKVGALFFTLACIRDAHSLARTDRSEEEQEASTARVE